MPNLGVWGAGHHAGLLPGAARSPQDVSAGAGLKRSSTLSILR